MKLLVKAIGIGMIVTAAIAFDRDRLRRAGRLDVGLGRSGVRGVEPGVGSGVTEDIAEAVLVGIADVDPVPLASPLEAIDPDAADEAHRSVQEQRARLPIRGKDLP